MQGFDRLQVAAPDLARRCFEFDVRELAAFGSVLRDDFTKDSDVDLLVEFGAERRVSLFELIRLQHRLEDLVVGRADLVPKHGLEPLIRDQVLASARVVHAA